MSEQPDSGIGTAIVRAATSAAEVVTSSLGFFVLLVAILAPTLLAVIGLTGLSPTQDLIVIFAFLAVIFGGALAVAFFTYHNPDALGGVRNRVRDINEFVDEGLSAYVRTAVVNLVKRDALLAPPPEEEDEDG